VLTIRTGSSLAHHVIPYGSIQLGPLWTCSPFPTIPFHTPHSIHLTPSRLDHNLHLGKCLPTHEPGLTSDLELGFQTTNRQRNLPSRTSPGLPLPLLPTLSPPPRLPRFLDEGAGLRNVERPSYFDSELRNTEPNSCCTYSISSPSSRRPSGSKILAGVIRLNPSYTGRIKVYRPDSDSA
jgi:hypothetical protein